jgi:zinc protease
MRAHHPTLRETFLPISIAGLLSSVVLAIALLAGSAQAAAPPSQPSEFELANGLRVVVVPDHRAPIVTHMVFYKIGSADERPEEAGLAHYLEHMMFMGTPTFPKGEFDRFVMRGGGAHNATTTQDGTTYYQRMPRNALERLMALEADRMENLQFTEAAALNERNVVMEEYRGKAGQPGYAFFLATAPALYGGHPYALPPIGSEEAISKFDGAKAMAFYRHHYSPQHAIVVIGGDVTEAEVREMAARTYGRITRRDDVASPALPRPDLPAEALRVVVPHPLASSATISRTYLTQSATEMPLRDSTALSIFSYIVGQGMLSRLHGDLVAKGLASAVSSDLMLRRSSSEVTFTATALPGVGVDVIEPAFNKALAEIAEHGISEREFDDMKQSFIAARVYDEDNLTTHCNVIGALMVAGWSLDDIQGFHARLEDTTVEDVNRVGKSLLAHSRNVTGVLVPQRVQAAGLDR